MLSVERREIERADKNLYQQLTDIYQGIDKFNLSGLLKDKSFIWSWLDCKRSTNIFIQIKGFDEKTVIPVTQATAICHLDPYNPFLSLEMEFDKGKIHYDVVWRMIIDDNHQSQNLPLIADCIISYPIDRFNEDRKVTYFNGHTRPTSTYRPGPNTAIITYRNKLDYYLSLPDSNKYLLRVPKTIRLDPEKFSDLAKQLMKEQREDQKILDYKPIESRKTIW